MTVVMQIYDFLYHVVFQYIFLLSIQLCCYHAFSQRSYTIRSYLLLSFYISKQVSSVVITFLRNVIFNIYN